MYIDSSKTTQGHGLFGHSYTVKNLTVKDGKVKGNTKTGGIVGVCWSGKIENCHNDNTECILKEGAYNTVGGVVGIGCGTIEKCYNTGTVTQKGGGEGLGGIIGETPTNQTTKILNCYNTGKVIEEASNIDGVGGVLGYISKTGASGEISHNYNIGEIEIKGTNVKNVGGAVGRYTATTFTIENNYYELNKSNVTLNNLGEGRTQANMKTTEFLNLLNGNQSPSIWKLDTTNNGYPTLK